MSGGNKKLLPMLPKKGSAATLRQHFKNIERQEVKNICCRCCRKT
jgi:hypothetical protein